MGIFQIRGFILRAFNKNDRMEDHFMRSITVIVWVFLIPSLIGTQFLGIPGYMNVLVLVIIVIYSFIFVYSAYYPITRTLRMIFLGIGMILMAPCYFWTGGLAGSIPYYFFLVLFIGLIIFWETSFFLIPFILFAELIGLIGLEYFFPEWILPFESQQSQLVYIGMASITSFGLMIWLVSIFHKLYQKDREQLLGVQKELEEARLQAEKASSTKSDFLARMSHELRTPLNTMIGATDLLKKDVLNTEQEELVSLMDNSSTVLLTLISDILDLSKIEAEKLELDPGSMKVVKLIEDVSQFTKFIVLGSSKPISFITSVGDDLPAVIRADEVRLKQVLTNLLSNAVKYTNEGEIRFGVQYLPDHKKGEVLSFTISDTGIGISEEEIKSIFEPFSQVSGNVVQRAGGVGLGLAISKSLAELMGGELLINSIPGEGSRFIFILPVVWENKADEEESYNRGKLELDLSSARILLAEDNPVNQAIILKLLQRLGIEADLANDRAEALEKVRVKPYDVVLMDVQMPVMNGIEATGRILQEKEINPKPAIVALTANALKEDKKRCLDAGMTDFLSKPVNSERLLQAVSSAYQKQVYRLRSNS